MINQYAKPIFERQKAKFPDLVQKLETLRDYPDPRKTTFLAIAAIVAHDLRNELTIIGVVLELEQCKAPEKVECTVLPG